MRIAFFGTSAFAVPSLHALHTAGHALALVVSQPNRPAGRGQREQASPLVEAARTRHLPITQPQNAKDPALLAQLSALALDLIVVVSYGHLIPPPILHLPRLRCVNVHPSLLPRYRGAAPINWPILNGDTDTGVTIMYMVEAMDAGDILRQERTPIGAAETAAHLHDRLALLGADLLVQTVHNLDAGTIIPVPQDPARVTIARKLSKDDSPIDWRLGAQQIINRIRGLQPWPGASTTLQGQQIKIFGAEIPDDRSVPADAVPGQIIAVTRSLHIVTGDGRLCLTELQVPGKKRMQSEDVLRGFPVQPGERCT